MAKAIAHSSGRQFWAVCHAFLWLLLGVLSAIDTTTPHNQHKCQRQGGGWRTRRFHLLHSFNFWKYRKNHAQWHYGYKTTSEHPYEECGSRAREKKHRSRWGSNSSSGMLIVFFTLTPWIDGFCGRRGRTSVLGGFVGWFCPLACYKACLFEKWFLKSTQCHFQVCASHVGASVTVADYS